MGLSTQQQMLVEQRLANDKKSTLVAYLLWFFLGGLGAHRFYLGRTASAVVMLAICIVGVLTFAIMIGIPLLLAVGIWALVDAFLIPGMIASATSEARRRISAELSASVAEA